MDYFLAFGTNFTDLAPLAFLYTNTIWSLTHPEPLGYNFWVIQSLAAIFLWLKFI
jgi:hypothetical protein